MPRTAKARPGKPAMAKPGKADRPKRASSKKRAPAPNDGSRLHFTVGDGSTYSVSWRALMLLSALAVAFVLLAPTMQYYLRQQALESAVNEEVAAAEARAADLEREIARWSDPAFVETQARQRLGYVMPGQQIYKVVDPEVVVGEEEQAEFEAQRDVRRAPPGPWYGQLLDSVKLAGGTAVGDEGDANAMEFLWVGSRDMAPVSP